MKLMSQTGHSCVSGWLLWQPQLRWYQLWGLFQSVSRDQTWDSQRHEGVLQTASSHVPPTTRGQPLHSHFLSEGTVSCWHTSHCVPFQNSGDFSQYQLAGLLQRNQLNQRLEGVEKEMTERSTGSTSQLYQQNGQDHSVESRRLVSEDNSHYILIKGEDGRVHGHVLVSMTQGRGHQRGAP